MKVLALVLGIVASAFAQGKSVGWIKIAARWSEWKLLPAILS